MSNYLLASAMEAERLQLQAQVWQPAAEEMLDAIGIQPGWFCLDLGCGAMGFLLRYLSVFGVRSSLKETGG
jgi:hypothetical protein